MTDIFKLNEEVLISEKCSFNYCIGKKGIIVNILTLTGYYEVSIEDEIYRLWGSSLTKLQDKPMKNTQDIKVGDPVRILADAEIKCKKTMADWSSAKAETIGLTGKVDDTAKEAARVFFHEIGFYAWYAYDALEKIIQENEQIKLEIGQKYDIEGRNSENPYIYLHDKRQLGFENNEFPLVFIDKDGSPESFKLWMLKKIKKHSELFKHISKAYTVVCSNNNPHDGCLITTDKMEAQDACHGCDSVIEGEITFIEKSK